MMFLKNFKIYDSEMCPCGSGKIYSECCKNKHDKKESEKEKKKPLNVRVMEKMNSSKFSCCLYPDKSKCVRHIKNAHALQNKKIISKLAVDGHVYMLNTKKKPLIIPVNKKEVEVLTLMDRVGVTEATTFNCFCDTHDDEVFAPIEKNCPNFNENSQQHIFLYAYKAFIFEYYKELVNQRSFQKMFKEKPSLLKTHFCIREYRNLVNKLDEMEEFKNFFDNGLIKADYTGLETCIIKIPKEIKFANYACIGLNYNLDGTKIKNVSNKKMKRVLVTIFPENDYSYIILSIHKNDKKIYEKLFIQLKEYPLEKIELYFNIVLPLYSENIVLSPLLWQSWDEEVKMAFEFYCNRQGNQFVIYDKIIKHALKNLRKNKIEDNSKVLCNLFE